MSAPLADRIRPESLDDVIGQSHLLGNNMPLREIINSGEIPNMIFYGPSGVGKTTVAKIIAKKTNKSLRKLNATIASTSDIRDVLDQVDTFHAPNGILLYLDEIQYFNKKQQQTLLEFIENGKITLIASTTENPYFYIYNAILSRATVFEFKSANKKEIERAVKRAFKFLCEERDENIIASDNIVSIIASSCGGDVRKSINAVELCVLATPIENGTRNIKEETARQLTQCSSMKYDKNGDEHYDLLSAFQKSMRGSDSNAAVYYLARLLKAGALTSVCRRLLVCACEDVGLAYPHIIPIVKACTDIALQVGMPEARIPLADAVVMVANSPKSNSGYMAINNASSDIDNGKIFPIPRHLQNMHYDGEDNNNKGQFYIYPHDFNNNWVKQEYLPKELRGSVYYNFGNNKNEQAFKAYWDKIRKQD